MEIHYLVAVYCLTYNHEKYIRKTLEGFVSQKTSFPFKVIVHDDASTDRTAEIIKEYAEKYPEIIFPIIQTENQYSKGMRIFNEIIFPHLNSKYVAVCEGDDYWFAENKLQMQFDYMETNPDCSLCVHNTKRIDENGNDIGQNVNDCIEERDYNANEVIAAGGGGLFQTSSVFCRLDDRIKMPSEFRFPGMGDYQLAIYLSTKGYVHYIPKVMSAYRLGSIGGWTDRLKRDPKKYISHFENMIQWLKRLNKYLDYKYDKGFSDAITKHQYQLWLYKNYVWHIVFNRNTRLYFVKNNSFKTRMIILVKGTAKFILRNCLKVGNKNQGDK